jgi:hypothetical protein
MKLIPARFRGSVLTAVAAVLIIGRAQAQQADVPKKLDEPAAQRLAAAAWGHNIEPKWFDYGPDMSPPFFVFYGMSKPPAEGGFGYFAVNPWTGDVWALWGCHKLSSPAARKIQADIRRRFAAEELKQYPQLSRLKPECIVED